tara:strand:- start:55 stop:744 length:690 start_codon:yes stop_codon:yes gene_type:complete
MLKFKLDSKSFTALNEVEQSFYAKLGEGYELQVEGAADKSKLDEFRSSNVEHMKKAELYKGVDLEKYRAMEEQERQLKDQELIKSGDIEGLVSQRTTSIVSDYEAKISTLNEQIKSSTGNYNTVVSKYEIEGAAVKAFTEHKISPDAFDAIMSQINNKFSIDNGRVIAKDGDNILAGANGNLTVSEFVASQPEIFKIQSSGGNGSGNNSNTGMSNPDSLRAAYTKMLSK